MSRGRGSRVLIGGAPGAERIGEQPEAVPERLPTARHLGDPHEDGLATESGRRLAVRGLEKAARIKRQLGGSGDYADPDPERPKGMHRRTYERLCNEAAAAQLPYQDRIMKRLHGFLAKSGLLPQTESERPDEEQVMWGVQRALERPELLRRTKRARGRGRTKNSRSPGA